MKPTAERYQAAVQTNALSPEMKDIEMADSVRELEGSIGSGAMASLTYFPGSQAAAWYRRDYVGTWESLYTLCKKAHFGYVRIKNPGQIGYLPDHHWR